MLRAAIFATVLLCATPAFAQLAPLPPQPADVPWPTSEWTSAPLPDDVDRPTFDMAITEAFADPNHDEYGQTRALVIVQGGRIVFERYGEGFNGDSRLISWSMAKSVTQALVGAAVLQGRVDIDTPMGNPRWRANDPRAAIPWRTWLQMTDGQDYTEIGARNVMENGSAHMLFGAGRTDTARWASGLRLIHAPGEHWNYNSAGTVLVSDALTRVIAPDVANADDRRARMRAWMDEALFGPLGMHPVVQFDAQGLFYGSSQIYATGRDFARFGLLYLRDGVWDGARVLPEGWVDFARTQGPDGDVYGAHWWLTPTTGEGTPMRALITNNAMSDAFSAQGHSGQIILVVPSKDLVIVRLGLFDDNTERWNALGDWMGAVAGSFGDR